MPKLGLTMTEATIKEWLKAPGDAVKKGEILFNYDTEKVSLDYEAPDDGVLIEIVVAAGITVPAGAVVCEYRTAADVQPAAPRAPGAGRVVATPKARRLAAGWQIDLAGIAGRGPGGRVQAADVEGARLAAQPAHAEEEAARATPVARRVAEAEGVNLNRLQGSGPAGRVMRADVERAAEAGDRKPGPENQEQGTGPSPYAPLPAPSEVIIPLMGPRQVIAQRMAASAFTAPHVTLFTEAEATNLVSARVQLNQAPAEGPRELAPEDKISYNALLAAIVARALREHPAFNSRIEADGIHLLPAVNVALAVDTERGLMTPVLEHADRLTLLAVQRGYAALIARALAGTSLPGDLAGGTFTISNLGHLGVDGFTPIINPPQAAILGVGQIADKPVAREGVVVVRAMMALSLSFDHRIADGAAAARFLARIKQLIERPIALLR